MTTTATKEEAAPARVPKLRFPKFRGAEGWATKPLCEVCSKITQGGTPDTTKSEYWGGSICWITPAEMGKSDSPFLGESIRTINEQGLRDCASDLLPVNSVILSVRAPIGHLAINTVPMAINQGCKGLIGSSALDHFFLYYSLVVAKPKLTDLGAGNTFKELSGSALKSFVIPLPPVAEQQKIAECLSSVDELIAAQARKVDALKTHKKGLMQQLFPREGETQPRLRFPEFQNAGEWEEKKLGAVCDIQRGKFSHRPRNDPRFFGGPYPFIQTGDVVKSEGGAVIASQSLNEEGLAVSRLFKPTIVLITIAANIGDTGLLQTEGCFTDSVVGLIPKKNVIPVFLELTMRGQKENLNKVATTGAQKNINNEILREVSLLLPSVPEQHRIATCLSSLDALITAETQKLETLKTHKRGLMQQLFPSPEEVEA